MAVYELDGVAPLIADSAWIAGSAEVIGDVKLGENVSIWPAAVLRGDTDSITIGDGTNIQDGSVLHADKGKPLQIGKNVTAGHQVMLHGCTIGDESLIGIGSVILNGAVIGRNSLVGARSLVTEGKVFPDGVMILGSPAKVVRSLTDDEIEGLRRSAAHYVQNGQRFKKGLKKLG